MGKILTKEKSSLEEARNNEEPLTLTPNLLEHPLFSRSEDGMLSLIIDTLNFPAPHVSDGESFVQQDLLFAQQLSEILENPEEYTSQFNKINNSNISSCGKTISVDEVYFRCLDCEVCEEPAISKQCQDCFMKSNHDGHRIIRTKPIENVIDTCDCGVKDMLNPAGFCPNHQHQDRSLEEALKDFPKSVYEKFLTLHKKIVYGIICLCEISEKAANKKVKEAVSRTADNLMQSMFQFFSDCIKDISKSFLLLFEVLVQSKFETPNNLVWHDCDDLSDRNHDRGPQIRQPHACGCSIFGALARFSRKFSIEVQTQLTDVLVECSKEKRFRAFLVPQFSKYSNLIFANPTLEEARNQDYLKLPRLFPKTLAPDENIIKSFKQFIETAKRAALHYAGSPIPNNQTFLHVGFGIAYYVQRSASAEQILMETDIIKEFFELLTLFQTKVMYPGDVKLGLFRHNIDYDSLDQIINAAKCVLGTLEIAFQKSRTFSAENKLKFFRQVASIWYTQFQKAKAILDHERLFQRKTYLTSGLEEILCTMIVYYLDDITIEGVEKFMREFFPDIYPSSLAADAIGGVLTTIGIMRFVDILLSTDVPLDKTYYFPLFGIFEMDVVFTQLMTLLIRPEDLFSVFSRNFFSYSQELKDFCEHHQHPQTIITHPNSRQMILALEDFLRFFIYIMNDETCLMNLVLRDQLTKDDSYIAPEKIVRKILINLLLTTHWTDITWIKQISLSFLSDNVRVPTTKYLSKIIVKDEETYKFKLKDEFESEVDPYAFYKMYEDQKHQQNLLTATERVNVKGDLVSGQFYTDLPDYLKRIQLNIFQSQLPRFLTHLLNNFTQEMSDLLHPALKLVLFNLQVVSDLLNNSKEHTEVLLNKVKENYLNKDFSKNLNEIAEHRDFQECKVCIGKIQALIKELSVKLLPDQPLTNPEEEEKSRENLLEEKKRQAKEKMERLKGEFAQKQAVFAEKNKDLLSQVTDSPEPKKAREQANDEKELVCQYCLNTIQTETEDYGVPIFVEFTNNLYNTEDLKEPTFKAENYLMMSATRWFPVISSCNHYYHENCFDSHFQSSRGIQNESMIFSNEYEVQCALCKTLSNNFLVMNKNYQKESSAERSGKFSLTIRNILWYLRYTLISLNNPPDQQVNEKDYVLLEEILKRSYEYFIETFYLYEKPQALEEALKLYINFARAFRDGIKAAHEEKHAVPIDMQETIVNGQMTIESITKKKMFQLLQGRSSTVDIQFKEIFLEKDHLREVRAFLALAVLKFMETEVAGCPRLLKEIFAFYSQDKTLEDKLIEKCKFSIKKILFAYYVNKTIISNQLPVALDSEIIKLLWSPQIDSESLEFVLKRLEIPNSFTQLVEESFTEFQAVRGSEISLDFLRSTFTIKPLKLAPRYIELPKSYLDFNKKFFKQKCSACNKVCQSLVINTCLICGEVLCALKCEDVTGETPGNLSVHASKYHLGIGLYYGIDHHELLIVKCPLTFSVILKAYIDELGQSFEAMRLGELPLQRSVDFKQFNLDRKKEKTIRTIISQHSMGKEIFERSMLDPEGLSDANRI